MFALRPSRRPLTGSKDGTQPRYCRACLAHWKRVMGVSAAKQVFEQAPESVRTWIKDRSWK